MQNMNRPEKTLFIDKVAYLFCLVLNLLSKHLNKAMIML